MLIYTCRFIEDFNTVITDKPHFPVLYAELPHAAALSPIPALWSRLSVQLLQDCLRAELDPQI